MNRSELILVWALLGLSFAVRLLHLTGPLDEPMWRQTDTAYMARRMMAESPPDLLNPKAPYRGTNDVKAAEFPIYPALAAAAYKAVGHESLPSARLVTLLFFIGSAWLLFLSVRLFADDRIAWWATLIYSVAPLALAYSRMVHPDYSIVFFSHLFLFALLKFVQIGGWGWWSLAAVGAAGAFLMKAPYCFYLGLLPGWMWLTDRNKRTIIRFVGLATVLILPLIAALWFNQHRIAQEAPFAESLVYPMKWTSETSSGRFFGHLAQRIELESWKLIIKRLIFMILTPVGVVLALFGLWVARPRVAGSWMPLVWLAGAGLYTLVVFPMVAGPHEYYSIPLIAPAALLAAAGINRVINWAADRMGWNRMVTTGVLAVLLLAGVREGLARGPYLAGLPFYSVDWQREIAGEVIAKHTQPDELVLSVTHGRSTGWSDPRILYVADRRGWAIEARTLNASNLAAFVEAGADVAAVLVAPEAESREDELGPLARQPHETVELVHGGKTIGTVRFYHLPTAISHLTHP